MLEDKGIYVPPRIEMVTGKEARQGLGKRWRAQKKRGLYSNKTKQALYIIA
jgi:hypothetical protein